MPTKKYYADVYFYVCPSCKRQTLGKNYFALFDLAEMGAAKRAGMIKYRCIHADCNAVYGSDRLLTNGEAVEVSEGEARSNGLAYESKGSA